MLEFNSSELNIDLQLKITNLTSTTQQLECLTITNNSKELIYRAYMRD